MARSNASQNKPAPQTPPETQATANPQDNARENVTPTNAGGADKVTDENQDLNEMQKAGEATTHPQPDEPTPPVAGGAKSAAQAVAEATRPESTLSHLKSNQMTGVVFLHPWQRYSPGDRAGFDPKTAAELIKREIAQKA